MINKVKIGDTSHDINDARIATFETSLSSNSNTSVPSSKAVADYVATQLTSALKYKGTIGSSGATVTALPASHKVGDVYVVSVAGTYAGKAVEVGDYIVCRTAGSTANDAHWDVINGENQVTDNNPTLSWGTKSKVATIDGVDINVTMPSNPNTNTHYTAVPVLGGSSATSNATSATSNPYLNIVENSAKSGGVQIKGGGSTTVSAVNGVVTISSTDNNTWRPVGTGATDAAAGNHTHGISIAADSGTNQLSLAASTKYKLTAGGQSFIFTTPADTNTWRPVGTGASDAAAGNHTHGISIATDTGTNALTMAANTKYKITAGGQSFIFTTPPDSNTTYTLAGLMGSSAKGGTTQPVYWDGSAWQNTSYTLGKSVPSNAVFTDTWTAASTSAAGYVPAATKGKFLHSNASTGALEWVDDNNTTYTLAGLMGSSAKGSGTQPVYWDGSAWQNTTYTLAKSVPSNAVFTDTWTAASTSAAGYVPAATKGKYLHSNASTGALEWVDDRYEANTNTTYKINLNGTDTGGGTTSLGTIYGATTAGTSGQYLKSSGSGAPTWANMPTSLPASDVYSWAKASSKPTYTASEVGAAPAISVSNQGTSNTTLSINPNTMYIWGTVSSLTITLATPSNSNILNEYMFQFTSGSTATTLSLPSTVKWLDGEEPSIEASMTYEVSIVNNLAVCKGFA